VRARRLAEARAQSASDGNDADLMRDGESDDEQA
jgi:hypothetical protein